MSEEKKDIQVKPDLFLTMEDEDEKQIMKQLEGQIVTDLFYEVDGKRGLSIAGVNLMAMKIGGIRVVPGSDRLWYDSDTGEYVATVVAENVATNTSSLGSSVQPKNMKRRDGSEVYDHFARVKALSKAERNAKRKVIPEPLCVAYLEFFVGLSRGVKGKAPPPQTRPSGLKPPEQVDAEYKVQETEQRVRTPTSPPVLGSGDEAPIENDIQDAIASVGLDPQGIEITRQGSGLVVSRMWPKIEDNEESKRVWRNYDNVLKNFGSVYHGANDADTTLRGKWTIGA